jgi:hypothetical protein
MPEQLAGANVNAKGRVRKRAAEACTFCRRRKVRHLNESPHQVPDSCRSLLNKH